MYILAALFLIVFEMASEGLVSSGHKEIAGVIEFVYLAGVTLSVFAVVTGRSLMRYQREFTKILIGYVLLRFAIADLIWNISAGQSWLYIGNTKWYDQIWGWFFQTTNVSLELLVTFKVMALLAGISLLTWKLRK